MDFKGSECVSEGFICWGVKWKVDVVDGFIVYVYSDYVNRYLRDKFNDFYL